MRLLRLTSLTIAILTGTTVLAQLQKITLNATTSTFSPAITLLGVGGVGPWEIAWTTNYEIRTVFAEEGPGLLLHQNDLGRPLGQYSLHGPALAVFKNLTYIAWTGTDKYARLNVMSSKDGKNFGSKVTLPFESSAYGPALAVFNNQLYLAWTDVDQHSLNIRWSADGVTWKPEDKQILGQSSIAGPALMSTPPDWPNTGARQQLFITWTGPDKRMNIVGTDDGVFSDFSNTRIPSETSNDRPVLNATHAFAGNVPNPPYGYPLMSLWFTGTDSRLNRLISVNVTQPVAGTSFGQKKTFDDTSVAGPSIIRGYLAWSGTDSAHHLNIRLME